MQAKHFGAFSSFTPALLWEKRNRALLIQLIVFECLALQRALTGQVAARALLSHEKRFAPYDWASAYGHLNKVREHALLLPHVFPDHARAYQLLEKKATASPHGKGATIKMRCAKCLPAIFSALEPFIETCKDNENLLFFLVSHRAEIEAFMSAGYLRALLLRLHPRGISDLCEKVCDNYHHRGFYSLIPEITRLLNV